MALVDWIVNLTPHHRLLFALPFVVVAVGLLGEWWLERRGHTTKVPRSAPTSE